MQSWPGTDDRLKSGKSREGFNVWKERRRFFLFQSSCSCNNKKLSFSLIETKCCVPRSCLLVWNENSAAGSAARKDRRRPQDAPISRKQKLSKSPLASPLQIISEKHFTYRHWFVLSLLSLIDRQLLVTRVTCTGVGSGGRTHVRARPTGAGLLKYHLPNNHYLLFACATAPPPPHNVDIMWFTGLYRRFETKRGGDGGGGGGGGGSGGGGGGGDGTIVVVVTGDGDIDKERTRQTSRHSILSLRWR